MPRSLRLSLLAAVFLVSVRSPLSAGLPEGAPTRPPMPPGEEILSAPAEPPAPSERYWIEVPAKNSRERTEVATAGVAIEEIEGDKVRGVSDAEGIRILTGKGRAPLKATPLSKIKPEGFPAGDEAFHDHGEVQAALQAVASAHPDVTEVFSLGTSLQGRALLGVKLTLKDGSPPGSKPGAFFVGTHHAREHLSTEVPLLLARHLAEHKKDPGIRELLAKREVFIVPMVNPDGAEHDIDRTDRQGYRWHRKNMRRNRDESVGVDLNRNYDFRFGGEGASDRPSSDVYHGTHAFSEPESQAVKAFLEGHRNIKVLLSYHTFSELVLWPWGGADEPVPDSKDRAAFEKIGRTMAQWNGYAPKKSSDLYVATGDTCDWAYGALGIFAFTFELTPKSQWEGGFYPGAKVIEPTFQKNLKPALYLIGLADDPRRVLDPS